MSANGGEAAQVTRKGGMAAFESLDGKTVYYTKRSRTSSLWSIPVEGGSESELVAAVAYRAFAVVQGWNLFRFKTRLWRRLRGSVSQLSHPEDQACHEDREVTAFWSDCFPGWAMAPLISRARSGG